MEKDNFISYLSMGQDSFSCEFDVSKETQIEVIVDDNKLEYLNDYIIENFNQKIKIIKLKEKLGSSLNPKLIILKRNPDIKRETTFNDNSQIQANLLNLEFNNIIKNQQYLNDFLSEIADNLLNKSTTTNPEKPEEPKPEEPEEGTCSGCCCCKGLCNCCDDNSNNGGGENVVNSGLDSST